MHVVNTCISLQLLQVSYLCCDVHHRLYGGAVQVSVVLSGFYEEMRFDIPLHLVGGRHEMIIPSIDLEQPFKKNILDSCYKAKWGTRTS